MTRALRYGLAAAVLVATAVAAQTFQTWRGPAGEDFPGFVLACPTGTGRAAVPCGTAANPVAVAPASPASLTAASAVVALPQNTATQIAASGLKRFGVQVQGTSRVLIGFDNTVCSAGYRIDPPASATAQGPIQTWYPANSSAYWACAPDAASSVFVERGQ